MKNALFAAAAFGLALSPLAAFGESPGTGPQHAIAMHGEPALAPDFTHFPYVNPDAPKGGTRRQAAISTFDSFNGFIIKGNGVSPPGLYDTLMVTSSDEPFTKYGLLAETIETPEDRSWVQFVLREEARWHDGTPVTPADVIWTFNTLITQGRPVYRSYYASVDTVDQVGERGVKFTFKSGENQELPLILGELQILPKHYWADRNFDETTLEPPLGSGPYRVGDFETGRYIRMERVADYWAADLPVKVGHHNFDVEHIDFYRDATVAIEAFKAGEYDQRAENSSKAWATAYDIPAVTRGDLIKEQILHSRPAGMQGFVFNMRRPIFQDPKTREALAYAFDFAWSNETLFYGQYIRSRSYFNNSELAATGLPTPEELEILEPLRDQLPPRVFTEEYNPPATEGGSLRANLRTAVGLLREAGWALKDGVMTRESDGETLEFEILLRSPLFERIALPYAENLERIGVKASIRTVDPAQYFTRSEDFDFDMTVMVWGASESPGNEQRVYWTSEAAAQQASLNMAGLANSAIDQLVESVIAAPDRESLVTRVHALDRALQWSFLVVPHWHTNYDRLLRWAHIVRPEITPRLGPNSNTWWHDAEKAAALDRE